MTRKGDPDDDRQRDERHRCTICHRVIVPGEARWTLVTTIGVMRYTHDSCERASRQRTGTP